MIHAIFTIVTLLLFASSAAAQPGSFVVSGTGCGAPGAVTPTLSATTPPTLGQVFRFDLGNVPATASAGAVLLGLPVFGGFALDTIGMTGCLLYTDGRVINLRLGLSAPTGFAVLPIPNDPNLIGYRTEAQAAIIAPGTNAFGVVLSNAGTLMIGQ